MILYESLGTPRKAKFDPRSRYHRVLFSYFYDNLVSVGEKNPNVQISDNLHSSF